MVAPYSPHAKNRHVECWMSWRVRLDPPSAGKEAAVVQLVDVVEIDMICTDVQCMSRDVQPRSGKSHAVPMTRRSRSRGMRIRRPNLCCSRAFPVGECSVERNFRR